MIDHREEFRLDEALRRHAARELDGQLGRAERHFLAFASREKASDRRATRWTVWGAAAAAAACGALVWVLLAARQQGATRPPPERPGQASSATAETDDADLVELRRTVLWQTLDEGTLVVEDDVPLRKMRLQSLERVQWYDPDSRALIEATVPKEEVIFVGMQTY
jgi:hypothetical protein